MTVYMCGGTFEEILCGVYHAWTSRKGHNNVRLEIRSQCFQRELFTEYTEVLGDEKTFEKVFEAIQKLSSQVYEWVYTASLSCDWGRADKIYRFLVAAFHIGPQITNMLQMPAVYEVFELCRFVRNETHYLTEFIHFSQGPGGVLIGRAGPKNDVIAMTAPHFADRMPGENWMIYDEPRKKAVVHRAGAGWFAADLSGCIASETGEGEWAALNALLAGKEREDYGRLWKAFFDSVAVKERENPRCQRNHLPLRYRPYMTEFSSVPMRERNEMGDDSGLEAEAGLR